ncbi:hypothetical protein Tco_0780828 [Tanacetum coccineum]
MTTAGKVKTRKLLVEPRVLFPPVVFRETDTGKFQPLPEVEGKGKEKVGMEQAAQVLLNNLQTPKKKKPTEHTIFQRTYFCNQLNPSGSIRIHPSLNVALGLTESDTEQMRKSSPDSQEESQPLSLHPLITLPGDSLAGPNTIPPQNLEASAKRAKTRELEQHIADLVDANQDLEERLDKHGSRLYRVTDAVDWAMQAPLRECFRDLPEADIKEILHNRMEKEEKEQGLPKTRKPAMALPPHPPPPAGGHLQSPLTLTSYGEDVGCDHIPTVNLRQSWWKPLTEDRPATPEPAWSIPSSDLTVPTNNWASALKSTYTPPPENSLLA